MEIDQMTIDVFVLLDNLERVNARILSEIDPWDLLIESIEKRLLDMNLVEAAEVEFEVPKDPYCSGSLYLSFGYIGWSRKQLYVRPYDRTFEEPLCTAHPDWKIPAIMALPKFLDMLITNTNRAIQQIETATE